MKEGITEILLNWLKTQGVAVVLLVCAIAYFYYDNKKIKTDLETCGLESKALEKEIRQMLTDVISKNTEQINQMDNTLKNYYYTAPYRQTPP